MQDRLPWLAESFSDPELHTGTVYKVTNWTALGHTAGFGRQARATLVRSAESDRHRADYYFAHGRAKRLWVHELRKDARTVLCARELAEEHAVALTAWMQAVDGSLPRTLAFDGKDIDGGKLGAIVTLAHHRDGTPAALIAASGAKADSELPAAQRLLADPDMNLEGALITADALHTQKETLRTIVERGGDYLIALKDNQPAAHAEAARLLRGEPVLFKKRKADTVALKPASCGSIPSNP